EMDALAVQVEAEGGDAEALAASVTETLKLRADSVSGWSVEQHLYHIALATDLAFRNVRSLVARKGRLIVEEGAIADEAAAVLRDRATRRGVANAPRMVTPDADVDPGFLAMELAGIRDGLEALRGSADGIRDAPHWIPHQILGPLAAPHWLRFATMHANHHLSIVDDVLAAARG
ncbi:MAG: DinB family protein, partial [Planctomycetota bacterium]